MRIDILSAVPELLDSPLSHSIVKRARTKGQIEIWIHDLHDYSSDKHRKIDDEMYGGGAGLVMGIEPIANCISELQGNRDYDEVILMTPDGEPLKQRHMESYALGGNIIIICGHYKGVDERVKEKFVTKEFSVGDYVLTGGELPAAILVDGIARLIPGVLNDGSSALTDSFQDSLLSPPVYTRPQNFEGMKVPDLLLEGDHQKIEDWRLEKALEKTRERRPDLLGENEKY